MIAQMLRKIIECEDICKWLTFQEDDQVVDIVEYEKDKQIRPQFNFNITYKGPVF